MNNRKLLTGACVFALAGALSTMPAFGSENETDADSNEAVEEVAESPFRIGTSPKIESSYSTTGSDLVGSNGLPDTFSRIELRSRRLRTLQA